MKIKRKANKALEIPSFEHFISERIKVQESVEKKNIERMRKILRHVDPIKSAAAFCGMATCGCLQSNHIRITNLIHASLKLASGKKKFKKSGLNILFNLMGGTTAGRDEDPAEDVFIATICSKNKSYLVFEGNWEGSSFILERFIDIVDHMPSDGHFGETKKSVHGLLQISNIIATRSGEPVNVVTCHIPEEKYLKSALLDPAILREKVKFSKNELLSHGIDPDSLRPFIFDISKGPELSLPVHRSLTLLDTHPILFNGEGDYFLFPQGVSTAIRKLVLSRYATTREGKEFLGANLLKSHQEILQKYHFLGVLPSQLTSAQLTHTGNILIFESLAIAPGGRPLHCIFVFDLFDGNVEDWFTPTSVNFEDGSLSITRRIEKVKDALPKHVCIKDGVSLLILAGWGRSLEIFHDFKESDNWSVRIIGIHDLCHLSDYPSMKPLHLWRIIRAEKALASLKGNILNMNGMLNLFGWLVKNDWHIVPHEDIPKDDLSASGIMLYIPTNMIADIRECSRSARDRRKLPDIDDNEKYVMKYEGKSYFKEDERLRLYGDLEAVKNGNLAAAYMGKSSLWWCGIKNLREKDLFNIWESATRWLPRIDQALHNKGLKIPKIIDWQLEIFSQKNDVPLTKQFSSTSLQKGTQVLTSIQVSPNTLFCKPDNSGEREMVLSFLRELLQDVREGEIKELLSYCRSAWNNNPHIREISVEN